MTDRGEKQMTVFFDLDGTLANLYSVPNWLAFLEKENPWPYIDAKVMHNMSRLARALNELKKYNIKIGIISWLSKNSSDDYAIKVTEAKQWWLSNHLRSVKFDYQYIIPYGINKTQFKFNDDDILFDDEEKNRTDWGEKAYCPDEIFTVLKQLVARND